MSDKNVPVNYIFTFTLEEINEVMTALDYIRFITQPDTVGHLDSAFNKLVNAKSLQLIQSKEPA